MWGEFAHALLEPCVEVGFLGGKGRGIGTAGRQRRLQASHCGRMRDRSLRLP
jgi:hypothetical protein